MWVIIGMLGLLGILIFLTISLVSALLRNGKWKKYFFFSFACACIVILSIIADHDVPYKIGYYFGYVIGYTVETVESWIGQ